MKGEDEGGRGGDEGEGMRVKGEGEGGRGDEGQGMRVKG